MKNLVPVILIVFLSAFNFFAQVRFQNITAETVEAVSDSTIKDIISSINTDSVKYFVNTLQNFGTRNAFDSNRDKIVSWIKQKYLSMGFTDVVLDSFYFFGTWQKNIIATLPGKSTNEICMVGAHYDSIIPASTSTPAPGADDNASGSALVLEIARVFKQKNYTPLCTIKFLAFGAEEYGIVGSTDYAAKCYSSGLNIKLMLNADMIGYTSLPLASSSVKLNYYTGSEGWFNLAKTMVSKYSVLTPIAGEANSIGSDSYSFWEKGYQSIFFVENQFSPYYHSSADTIGNYSMPYCTEIIKSACALLINACGFPAKVQNITLYDVGDGKSVKAEWTKSNSAYAKTYKIYAGGETQKYDAVYTTTDTTCIITGRTDGRPVFIAVSAVSGDGLESACLEKAITINSKPAAPLNAALTPEKKQITISWRRGSFALDFAGHNIYRADSADGIYIKQNSAAVTDTVFSDTKAKIGKEYYYYVCTVDNSGIESISTNIVKGRLASLDQGIGLIITSIDGDGSIGNPSKKQVEDFYKSLLGNYKYELQDISNGKNISFSYIGAFSTIIWANNSASENSTLLSSVTEITKYLKAGGNLLVTTLLPSTALSTTAGYVKTFKEGDFIYDYIKVASSKYVLTSRFSGAKSLSAGLDNMLIDTNKTLPDNMHQLSGIESITPTADGKAVYSYDSFNETNPLKGTPVAIEYSKGAYKTILTSFPLYYMDEQNVRNFIKYALQNSFNETVGLKENTQNNSAASKYALRQNYPNPFNPETRIEYNLIQPGNVTLKIYDVLGREVMVLLNKEQSAGSHYIIFNGSRLSSGIYYYRIQSGNFIETKKMLLIK